MMVEKSTLGLMLAKDALNAGLNTASLLDALRMEDRNHLLLMEKLDPSGGPLPDSTPPS
ncbi:MAG: hypothetical protein SWK76_03755 [Actinomycetota bacterium]|nr:hypothetical protein [Actinomycetota bacterium]